MCSSATSSRRSSARRRRQRTSRALPRVVERFEAGKPREAAVVSEIDGVVRHGRIVKGLRILVSGAGRARGDRIRAGESLMDGPHNPHDILAVLGEKELQHLQNEIQEVCRLQVVGINDKHIEGARFLGAIWGSNRCFERIDRFWRFVFRAKS